MATKARKRRIVVPRQDAWRQPYIDSFNQAAGHPAGLVYLHHNIAAIEEAARAHRERIENPSSTKTIYVKGISGRAPGGSVAKARAIFDRLKGETRAAMMAACDAAGINKGTAATQFGRWKKEQ